MSVKPIAFNGKFQSAAPTGVHRVAEALIGGVDRLLAAEPADGRAWELLQPRDARQTLGLQHIKPRTVGRLTWQPWEQFELPWVARKHLLVSLCNLAPVATRGGVTMIHDAQVFISPDSYSRAFRTWYQFALPRIGAAADRVLTVSDYSRQMLVKHGVAPAEKIEVLYNGVDHLGEVEPDPGVLQRLGLTPGTFAVALANTQVHKNIGLLFKAFALPALAGRRLVLVGSAGAADFEAIGQTPPPNAVFAGRVSDAELAALYGQAICLAFPSRTEGFGLPPLEAMKAGCPAVAAPCGALPEVCGEAAIYVDPDDPEGWAEAIAALGEDPIRRQALVDAGQVQAARFTWDASARKLLELIRSLAGA